jgi:ATP-dependent Lon protease
VLPIGGVKEKLLAARRAGITTIVVPKLNQKELDEVPAHLKRGIEFHMVEEVDEVLKLALVPPLVPGPGPREAKPLPSRTRTISV